MIWQTACEYYIKRVQEVFLTKSENGKKIFISTDPDKSNKESILQLRDVFTRAIDFFETSSIIREDKEENDTHLFPSELSLIWASIETNFFKDKAEMNKIMEKYIRNNGAIAEAWINYLNLEMYIKN